MLAGSCVDPDEQHIGGAVHVAAGRGEVTTTTATSGGTTAACGSESLTAYTACAQYIISCVSSLPLWLYVQYQNTY